MKSYLASSLLLSLILLAGCSSSKKFSDEDFRNAELNDNSSIIRVLVDEQKNMYSWSSDQPSFLKDGAKTIGLVKPGVVLLFTAEGNSTNLRIQNRTFSGKYFQILPDEGKRIQVKDKNYRGSLRISSSNGNIQVINTLRLEEYLRGVLPAEMPLGKGTDNYEALKAFAICARTYAYVQLNKSGNFDIHKDVRDQVYAGANSEKTISDKAVLETKGLLLTYNDKPAVVYYHSTCGGFTEEVGNVFSTKNAPYLQSLKDGEPSYCTISPRYQWQDSYSQLEFISRFKTAGLISGPNWNLKSIEVKNRFPSGRIKDLEISFADSDNVKTVFISGNNIRSIIRNSSNSSILNSNNFDISFNDTSGVIISGKGYGHGVGLCQFGSIYLSRNGKLYNEIIEHYFPGTSISRYYD